MDKSKIYLDLSKCTEEEQKHVFSLLPPEPHRDAYNIFRSYKYLQFIPKSKFQEKEKWMVDKQAFGKTELTYPEFIKLFKGGDGENDGWINIESEKDLPKDEDEFWVFENNEVTKTKRKIGIDNNDYWWLNNITHYQPIVKPEPPKL